MVVSRHSLSSYGRRAFAVVGPTTWNSLSDDLRDLMLSTDSFRCLLKTQLLICSLDVTIRISRLVKYKLLSLVHYHSEERVKFKRVSMVHNCLH